MLVKNIHMNRYNHKRVDVYTINQNKEFNNFAISPNYIFEDRLRFVYVKDGLHEEKIVPMKFLGPHLKYMKQIITTDPDTGKKTFHGKFYIIPEKVIFEFEAA